MRGLVFYRNEFAQEATNLIRLRRSVEHLEGSFFELDWKNRIRLESFCRQSHLGIPRTLRAGDRAIRDGCCDFEKRIRIARGSCGPRGGLERGFKKILKAGVPSFAQLPRGRRGMREHFQLRASAQAVEGHGLVRIGLERGKDFLQGRWQGGSCGGCERSLPLSFGLRFEKAGRNQDISVKLRKLKAERGEIGHDGWDGPGNEGRSRRRGLDERHSEALLNGGVDDRLGDLKEIRHARGSGLVE